MMTSELYDDLPLWSAPFGLTLLDTVRTRTGINILDIGSGSGFPMLELAERMGIESTIYGLEPSDDAISMISKKAALRDIGNINIVKGVAENMPFSDGFFGLIVSNNGLNNVQDPDRAAAECFRVAGEDAQMVFTVNLPHTMWEFYKVFESVLAGKGMTDEITRMHEHIGEKRKPVEYLRTLIENSGFMIRSIDVDGFKMKFTNGTSFLRHHLIRTAFRPPWEEILPERDAPEIFQSVEAKLNHIAKEQGELVISIPFACFDCIKPPIH